MAFIGIRRGFLGAHNVLLGRKVEPNSFEAVALPHLNDLYRTAVHLVRDRTEAHDLVQEAYVQAWKAFNRFEPGTTCRAWWFTILINEVRHYCRRWFNSNTAAEPQQSFEESLDIEPSF